MGTFGTYWHIRRFQKAYFRSIFARSALAVTPSEKRSIYTNIGSSQRAFQWAHDEHRTLPLGRERMAQKRKVSKNGTISCDNSETAGDMIILLLITNRKSHTGFRLIPTNWMTLNSAIALILRFSPNSVALLANYVTVVECIPIMSVKYCLPVPVFHFWP